MNARGGRDRDLGRPVNRLPAYLLLAGVVISGGCNRHVHTSRNRVAAPQIVSRSQWGSMEITTGYRPHKLTRITLHHSGVAYSGEDPADKKLRDLQVWSRQERNWVDIPYHFLIDLDGGIYEGRPLRYVGDTNTPYDPTGHALISVMGNYEEQPFREAQQEAVVRLIAWLCSAYNLSPDSLRGHRDYVATTVCPGRNIIALLHNGSLVARVKARLRSAD